MDISTSSCHEHVLSSICEANLRKEYDDEIVTLSDYALKALNEFYQEQKLNLLIDTAENSINLVDEDWELSQFWYDEDTAVTLKDIALNAAGKAGRIACISCPTVYTYLVHKSLKQTDEIYLFEYDKRFRDLHEEHFIVYDYNDPLNIPEHFKSYFDVVLVDPPYLSEECLGKTAETVKFIAKDKVILCTGATMEKLAYDLLDLQPNTFQPKHKRKLGNEFKCYSNFNVDKLIEKIKQNAN